MTKPPGQLGGFFSLCQFGDQLSLIQLRKSLFERSDGVHKIISAGCQRPGEHRILYLGAVEYAGLFLFSGDIAVENLDDAIDVGNQYSCLQRIPCWGRAPKMTLVFHFLLQMICSGTGQTVLGPLPQALARTLPARCREKVVGSFSGLAGVALARCNAPMFFRRLIAWFWPARPLRPRKAPGPIGNRTALDLDEFGRLLSTGKAEDLKKIARDLGQQEAAPEVRR